MKLLVAVDLQHDFIDGALANEEAKKIIDDVVTFIYDFDGEVVGTIDTHKDSEPTVEKSMIPTHCKIGSYGWKVHEKVAKAIIDKNGSFILKSTFGSYDLIDFINNLKEPLELITLIGICTDICVISIALMLRAAFPSIPIYVMEDLCAGTTPEMHNCCIIPI